MTVSDLCSFHTDELASHSRFFPADINVSHHQLRNLISSVYEGRLYYVHRHDIFVFDLQKEQRSLVATVHFEARCLAAAHGWVCVGGETKETKGECAFVRIGEDRSQAGNFGLDLVVETLGQDIVNSITIHRVPARQPEYQDEVVALISNNDMTVTLYSLSRQEVLTVLPHPRPMNYACMSPDCTLIAAVGDVNEAYFYQRRKGGKGGDAATGATQYEIYDWQPLATPAIPAGAGMPDDWSFAVAFSPDGALCAVSAQGGRITVFHVQTLLKHNVMAEKAIICTFRSSRPPLWGCVRSMAFSPAPWDLLAWTEDHGRIGIADVRRMFARRQHILLDKSASDMVEWEDTTPSEVHDLDLKDRLKHQHLQRMRMLRGQLPVGARSFEDAQRQQTQQDLTSYQTLDLNDSERSVLNALESTMTDVTHQVSGPYSVSYTSPPVVHPSATIRGQSGEPEPQPRNTGTGSYSFRAQPRRRQSIVFSNSTSNTHLTPSETPRAMMTASPASMSDDNTILTPPSTGSSSQNLSHNIPVSDPWHVIEVSLAANRARHSAVTGTRDNISTALQVESAVNAERQLLERLERQLADERRLSISLRVELEARERLADTQRQELRARMSSEGSSSPSIEQIVFRQFQVEQEQRRQRSHALQSEIQNNSQRMEQLNDEREQLLSRRRSLHQDSNFASGFTTALPLTSTSGGTDTNEIDLTARRAETESRVDHTEHDNREHERLLDARFLSAARAGPSASTLQQLRNAVRSNSSGDSSESSLQTAANRIRGAAVRRIEGAINVDRSTIPRTSELHGRVSDLDMRMARIMMQRAAMDANGNWVAGQSIRSILGTRRAADVTSAQPATRAMTIEAVLEDAGEGTAGIGWSPDGKFLYAGSKIGVFEFKVNIRDRMYFPALDMR